jgi:hypothetical protein
VYEGGIVKRPSRKALDQIGIMLLISGVVVGMGVSTLTARGMLKTWVEIVGLIVGLLLVVAGLWLARTFRKADPNRPHKPDAEL